MELLTEIAREEEIPVLINIHEVDLAVEHADRINGLANGEFVFEGTPEELDERAMDTIYRDETPGETDESRSREDRKDHDDPGQIIDRPGQGAH